MDLRCTFYSHHGFGEKSFGMLCPHHSFLKLFVADPDAALADLPEFESHLENCLNCRGHIDLLALETPASLGSLVFPGTATTSDRTVLPRVSGYDILERIGSGGFGTVYRGAHKASGRPVAIKIVQSVDPSHWKRIVLERETLVHCDHPNIITLLDFGQGDGACYFVYPWMPQTIAQEIAATPVLNLGTIVTWCSQMAHAVQYLHERGIVHRDLKPSNVLLSHSGTPKIADFGIAKDISETAEQLTTGGVIGTPGFMAPEQTGKSRSKVTAATDIYGLGAILYQLLTGRPPFTGADPTLLLDQIVNAAPVGPKKLRSDVPHDLEMICLKCLEKEPFDRYSSAQALRQEFDRFASGVPILARPLPVWKRVYRSVAKHPLVATLLSLIVMLVIGGAASYYLLDQQAKLREQQLFVFELANQIGSAAPDRIPELFKKAEQVDCGMLDRAIAEIASRSRDPIARLRWTVVRGQGKQNYAITPQETLEAISGMSLDELSLLTTFNLPSLVQSVLTTEQLQRELVETRSDPLRLRLAVCLAHLAPTWDGWSSVSPRLLRALQNRPVNECTVWAKLLQNVRSSLLDHFYERPSTDSMIEIAWQWSKNDRERMVRLITKLPIAQLSRLRSLDDAFATDLIARLQQEIVSTQVKPADEPPLEVISPRLLGLLKQHKCVLGAKGGMMLGMPVANSVDFIAALAENHMTLRTISTFEKEGQPCFAAVFEQSDEPCRVEWNFELKEVPAKMHSMRGLGWEPVCFALDPDRTSNKVSMLWRKGEWASSEWLEGSDVLKSAAGSILDSDTSELDLQLQVQAFTSSIGESLDFGLRTKRKISRRDESKRRMLTMYSIHPVADQQLYGDRSLEIIPEVDRYLQLSTELDSHLEQTAMLLELGYQPVEALVDTHGGALRMRSFWRLDRVPPTSTEVATRASLAIALWILGEPAELLECLQDLRDPSLRTRVVELLAQADRASDLLMSSLSKDLSPQQLQGLLIALMNCGPDQFELQRDEWKSTLNRLWQHPDSGVHFAADHLLMMVFPDESNSVVRPDLCLSHSLQSQTAKGCNWYYGPFGLPFVVIKSNGMELVGSDERIPWHVGIDRRVCKVNRKFAICAIETPLWLAKKFRDDTRLEFHDRNWIGNDTADSPVVGCGLNKMLQVCRWLSDVEEIDSSRINLPAMEAIGDGLKLPKDFLVREGYRLPSNLEWELACRGGSWGTSFLGETTEFLGEYAWSSSNSDNLPSNVARLKPNPLGLFDIVGNVYEAVIGESMTSGDSPDWERWQLTDTTALNLRGGSYLSSRIYCSSGSNHHIHANETDINAGFRIVRPLP